jgi:aspartate carbamoyltransferase catalytic subunit
VDSIDPVIASCDVLYQTRIQRERFAAGEHSDALSEVVVVNEALMSKLPGQAIVMQPLPRLDDIDPAIDSDPRAAYFRQAANGVTMRMALLERLLRGSEA